MVQLMRSGNPTLEPEVCRDKAPVKLEIVEDSLEEEYGPINKRSKLSSNLQQGNSDVNAFPIPPAHYNPLDEPSPLGLKLRKSTSLLDLIQMRLSQSQTSGSVAEAENSNSGVKKESKAAAATDKLKASNFPASILRIGHWEYKSKYEGDLVAKCYFAKHKLVWEVLEGGLKSKIEIQWSDIMALKANCPDNGPGTLNVVLARQPLFFRETNPQPRKHTLWQTTADFTDGQASIHRQHFLQCPQGLLNKHFEKLIQCDMRLNCLSRQPEIILDSPYFESKSSVFEDPGEPKGHDYCEGETGKVSTSSGFQNIASPAAAQSSSFEVEKGDSAAITSENMSREAPSPSSVSHLTLVMDSCGIEGSEVCETVDSKGPRNWDQIKVPGLHPSMSMSDLMNHIGHRLSEHMTSENPSSQNRPDCEEMLEDIAQYLLSDTQFTTASDEKSLMSRVNSLCCLLQKDATTGTSSQSNGENYNGPDDGKDVQVSKTHGFEFNITAKDDAKAYEGKTKEVSGSRQAPGMSRKDSFSELLLHLPRIASLPKFLFNISEEDGERQAR
ncbi:50S ribosomal protein L35 isoform 1 [Hibiscus syriacus]|uniref:50S ribosomal protein L35 isoform 1 n=1 Tax=Hibiscus syriacus TaxID=106335 RepID=A0A6A2Z7Q0_HIBSY|nr:50S ribosomal protein L35 isoform 1 [Hibiscus syriacus]